MRIDVSPPVASSFHSDGSAVRAEVLAGNGYVSEPASNWQRVVGERRTEVVDGVPSNGNGYHSVQANTSVSKQNRRRLFLIRKNFHSPAGLAIAEAMELTDLQTAFEAHLDATRPLPMEMLEDLERLAEELEAAEPGA